jgi:uncharacterized membrane protein YcjF (UPF0283 family)
VSKPGEDMTVFWQKAKWFAWAALGVIIVVMTLVVRRLFTSPSNKEWTVPPVPTAIQNSVEQAQENAQVAEAQANATEGAQQQQLSTILKVSDDAQRRQQLASFLQGLG